MCFRNIVSAVILILGLSACASTLYLPTDQDAVVQNVSLNTLIRGRELYISTCGGCHNLYLPAKYTNQEWILIMGKMQEKTKIDDSQKELITRYLITSAK